jgi:hypothetical protein
MNIRATLGSLRRARRGARRLARRTRAIGYRGIVVPLLERTETEHAVDLACRLAGERRAHVVLVAPLLVDQDLPLDAHFRAEESELRGRLDRAAAVADSYGVGVRRRIVRARAGGLGKALAETVADDRAELVVVGAPVESRRGFRKAFPREILSVVREAPCRVLIVTGPVAGQTRVSRWRGDGVRRTSSSAFSERTRSSRRPTATSARRSTTPSA